MKLYFADASPFARKVRIIIREAGLADRIQEEAIGLSPVAPNAELLAHNPFGKIPTLVRDDAPAIFDNRVICRFLCDLAGSDLYGGDKNWDMLTFEAMSDAMMDASVSIAYEMRLRAPEQQSSEWIEAQWGKVTRGLDAFTDQWRSHLAGPLNVGQIGVASALGYLDLRHDARNWRDGRTELANWFAEFESRKSFQETNPSP